MAAKPKTAAEQAPPAPRREGPSPAELTATLEKQAEVASAVRLERAARKDPAVREILAENARLRAELAALRA